MMKYKLDGKDVVTVDGRRLYRVIALKDIPKHGVKAGDKGGYISAQKGYWTRNKCDILSQNGSCWVGGQAKVLGEVSITGDALVTGNVTVRGLYELTSFGRKFLGMNDTIFIKGSAVIDGKGTIEFNEDNFGANVYGGSKRVIV